ncbi:hypothetical protein DOK_08589 [gamma proteobacterium BDW918]|nr:hypothetical protein DOK_08589 [gamma proteobacterium BDW918]
MIQNINSEFPNAFISSMEWSLLFDHSSDYKNLYDQKIAEINDSVFNLLGGNVLVEYCAYPLDSLRLPVNNLAELVVDGGAILYCPVLTASGDYRWVRKFYESLIWSEVLQLANSAAHVSQFYGGEFRLDGCRKVLVGQTWHVTIDLEPLFEPYEVDQDGVLID